MLNNRRENLDVIKKKRSAYNIYSQDASSCQYDGFLNVPLFKIYAFVLRNRKIPCLKNENNLSTIQLLQCRLQHCISYKQS